MKANNEERITIKIILMPFFLFFCSFICLLVYVFLPCKTDFIRFFSDQKEIWTNSFNKIHIYTGKLVRVHIGLKIPGTEDIYFNTTAASICCAGDDIL